MLTQHVVHTIRLLRKSPGFTATAVLTLALGIGANTAVFSVVDAVLLRRLPYADSDRLVSIGHVAEGRPRSSIAPGNLPDYQRARSFDGVAAYNRTSMTLTGFGAPEQVRAETVTWNLFSVVGVAPAIGRAFRPEEDREGGERVVILTHGFWRTKFGANPAVIGQRIALNTLGATVIGVMPEGFEPLSQPGSGYTIHLLVPAALSAARLSDRASGGLSLVARLRPDVTIATAEAEVRTISADLAERYPATNRGRSAGVEPLRDRSVQNVRVSLLVLLGSVALVLVIACVNLGNLLIVRAFDQRRDLAIRVALGASRGRIATELIVRGVVLGIFGGAAGLLLGVWIRNLLVSMAPVTVPGLDHVGLNPRVLGVTAGVSLLTGLLAGLLPALHVGRGETTTALRQGAATTTAVRSVARWRGLLMAIEIAAALMLTVGAGLLVGSLVRLTRVDLGFSTDGVLFFTVRPPAIRYGDGVARAAFFEEVERRLQSAPGVRAVALASEFPTRGGWRERVRLPGDTAERRVAGFQAVSPGYFPVLSIPLVRGRLLTPGDRPGAPLAAVVTELFEQRFLEGRSAVGERFRMADSTTEVTVVGVVGDIHRDGRQAPLTPQVFLSAAQVGSYPARIEEIAVATAGDPYALVPTVERTIWSIDRDQPITNVLSLCDLLLGGEAERRFNLRLLGAMALLALALALVGVYGVAAHAAQQRTREIGIRIALGARQGNVISLVVSDGLKWAAAGTIAGLAGAFAVSRVMTGLLFGVAPTDPATFAACGALTTAVVLVASYVPARRAAAADPLRALRFE